MEKDTRKAIRELEDHIVEVDHNHGQILVDVDRRLKEALDKIAQLEYKLDYIQQVVERKPGWLNEPAKPAPFPAPYMGDDLPTRPTITM